MAFDLTEYPPRTFRDKYTHYLAPKGTLVTPQQVFGNKKLGPAAEEGIRKAFKITIKKLKKLRSACAACEKEGATVECLGCKAVRYCNEECRVSRINTHAAVCRHLKDELLDQVVECLPSPLIPGPDMLRGRGGLVKDWNDWYNNHTSLGATFQHKSSIISLWWEYTGLTIPEVPEIEASLWRIYSNIFSTPLNVGHCALWFPDLAPAEKNKEFHIHLLGADEPEVKAVQQGIIQIASRVLGRPLVVTLVAPDLQNHPETMTWSPTSPFQCGPNVKAVAYPGLYHDFWQQHILSDKEKMKRPDVALAIHPGVHTEPMLILWKPTLQLLAKEQIPLAMTTYNQAEFEETLEKLAPLGLNIVRKEKNMLGSLHAKQTPYEPDHVWAANSYLIAIDNRGHNGSLS
ncbi:hypothetical protein O3P69_017451 [Scylla paramamosain]|uniref:MYND-type domain-containing protein n=1 Tax=Scylla paramamosain TaxID=85552 RepID=A0AAW0TVV6_SCYPA